MRVVRQGITKHVLKKTRSGNAQSAEMEKKKSCQDRVITARTRLEKDME